MYSFSSASNTGALRPLRKNIFVSEITVRLRKTGPFCLSEPAGPRRFTMTEKDKSTVLLKHYLETLKLPTMLRKYTGVS
jgi:hypothetical protein